MADQFESHTWRRFGAIQRNTHSFGALLVGLLIAACGSEPCATSDLVESTLLLEGGHSINLASAGVWHRELRYFVESGRSEVAHTLFIGDIPEYSCVDGGSSDGISLLYVILPVTDQMGESPATGVYPQRGPFVSLGGTAVADGRRLVLSPAAYADGEVEIQANGDRITIDIRDVQLDVVDAESSAPEGTLVLSGGISLCACDTFRTVAPSPPPPS